MSCAIAGVGLSLAGCAGQTSQPPRAATDQMLNVPPAQTAALQVPPTTAPAAMDGHAVLATAVGAEGLVGKKCRLQFRRDALGLNAPGILEPTAVSSAGKAVSLVGVVEQVTEGWVVVRANKQVYWVPTGQVLMIEVAE